MERRAPDGFANLDDVISMQELQSIAAKYKGTAGFDAQLLNTRPGCAARVLGRAVAQLLAHAGPDEHPIRSRWRHEAVPLWRRLTPTVVAEVTYTNVDLLVGSTAGSKS